MTQKHPLFSYALQVEKTHRGLGNMTAFLKLATNAKKCIIVVGGHGSGKTTAIDAVLADTASNNVLELDSVTRSGLKKFESQLTNFQGIFSVSDLGAIDTNYTIQESVKVLALLCYEHHVSKLNAMMDMRIDNFRGSALTTIQPVAVQHMVRGSQWDAVLMDKTVRYYHLYKPTAANLQPITASVKPKIPITAVTVPAAITRKIKALIQSTITQWSDARSEEHLIDFCKSAASFAGRKTAILQDWLVTLKLMNPLYLENYFLDRNEIEGQLFFSNADFVVLSELASYGKIDKIRMARNYKVSMRTVFRLLKDTKAWYVNDITNNRMIKPSAQALEVVSKCKGIV